MYIPNPLGRLGEQIALKYLENKGYKIIEKNFRKSYKEIDLIAIDKNILVFVEVKTRNNEYLGGAIEAISSSKIKKLVNAAQLYKFLNPKLPNQMRIDAILISKKPNNEFAVRHIENISGF